MASTFPAGQDRVLAIKDAMVYKFRTARERVATHHDFKSNYAWVCASELRRDGAADDAYVHFEDLHSRRCLLPCAEDHKRLVAEAGQRLINAIRLGAPVWVSAAQAGAETIFSAPLPGGCQALLFYRKGDGCEELWVAVPLLTAKEVGLPPDARAFLFAAVEAAFGAVLSDPAHMWPTRPLKKDCEIAYYMLR